MSDDTISRQAAIDAIYALSDDTIAWLDAAAEAVKELPSAKQWIPVSERLPLSREEVIVSVCDETGDTRYNYTSHGWLTTDNEYWIVDNEINNYVVAWMPLPEPYKGKEG